MITSINNSLFLVQKKAFMWKKLAKLKTLPNCGTTQFGFHCESLGLVNTFFNVGHVKITCGLLPTRLSSVLLWNYTTVKKHEKLLISLESLEKKQGVS